MVPIKMFTTILLAMFIAYVITVTIGGMLRMTPAMTGMLGCILSIILVNLVILRLSSKR